MGVCSIFEAIQQCRDLNDLHVLTHSEIWQTCSKIFAAIVNRWEELLPTTTEEDQRLAFGNKEFAMALFGEITVPDLPPADEIFLTSSLLDLGERGRHMSSCKASRPDFKLIPFVLCEGNPISFFLASSAKGENVINFIIEEEDCSSSDIFADSLSAAIDFMTMEKNNSFS